MSSADAKSAQGCQHFDANGDCIVSVSFLPPFGGRACVRAVLCMVAANCPLRTRCANGRPIATLEHMLAEGNRRTHTAAAALTLARPRWPVCQQERLVLFAVPSRRLHTIRRVLRQRRAAAAAANARCQYTKRETRLITKKLVRPRRNRKPSKHARLGVCVRRRFGNHALRLLSAVAAAPVERGEHASERAEAKHTKQAQPREHRNGKNGEENFGAERLTHSRCLFFPVCQSALACRFLFYRLMESSILFHFSTYSSSSSSDSLSLASPAASSSPPLRRHRVGRLFT